MGEDEAGIREQGAPAKRGFVRNWLDKLFWVPLNSQCRSRVCTAGSEIEEITGGAKAGIQVRADLSPWLESGGAESWVVPECDSSRRGETLHFLLATNEFMETPSSRFWKQLTKLLTYSSQAVPLWFYLKSFIHTSLTVKTRATVGVAETIGLAASRPGGMSAKPRAGDGRGDRVCGGCRVWSQLYILCEAVEATERVWFGR